MEGWEFEGKPRSPRRPPGRPPLGATAAQERGPRGGADALPAAPGAAARPRRPPRPGPSAPPRRPGLGRTHSMIRETCSRTGTLLSLKAVVMKQPKVSAAITLSEKANKEFARDSTVFIATVLPEPRSARTPGTPFRPRTGSLRSAPLAPRAFRERAQPRPRLLSGPPTRAGARAPASRDTPTLTAYRRHQSGTRRRGGVSPRKTRPLPSLPLQQAPRLAHPCFLVLGSGGQP